MVNIDRNLLTGCVGEDRSYKAIEKTPHSTSIFRPIEIYQRSSPYTSCGCGNVFIVAALSGTEKTFDSISSGVPFCGREYNQLGVNDGA